MNDNEVYWIECQKCGKTSGPTNWRYVCDSCRSRNVEFREWSNQCYERKFEESLCNIPWVGIRIASRIVDSIDNLYKPEITREEVLKIDGVGPASIDKIMLFLNNCNEHCEVIVDF